MRCGLHVVNFPVRIVRIHEISDDARFGHQLVQQLLSGLVAEATQLVQGHAMRRVRLRRCAHLFKRAWIGSSATYTNEILTRSDLAHTIIKAPNASLGEMPERFRTEVVEPLSIV